MYVDNLVLRLVAILCNDPLVLLRDRRVNELMPMNSEFEFAREDKRLRRQSLEVLVEPRFRELPVRLQRLPDPA